MVLVLALAAGLIAIAWPLNGARKDLARIAPALKAVRRNVEPLGGALEAANDGLRNVLDDLRRADGHLSRAKPCAGILQEDSP